MRKYLFLFVMLSANYISGFTQTEAKTPIILRGTIIFPEGVMLHGYVGIVNSRIVSVKQKKPRYSMYCKWLLNPISTFSLKNLMV